MTISDELKPLAKVCKSSTEFIIRAKKYVAEKYDFWAPLMKDNEYREIYREFEYEREVEKGWEKYNNTIRPMLRQRIECQHLWYEVWNDLSGSWIDKWMSTFRFMSDNEIVEVCVKFLNEQERFYKSEDYIDMLNSLKLHKIN